MNRHELELARRLEDLNKPSEDRVAPCFACPACGEDRTDHLVWDATGTVVTCASCNTDYDPCEA